MTANITPSILASKSVLGLVNSNQLGNVAWNDDGQCSYITKKGVTIMTPWLVSSLPPPQAVIDPEMEITRGAKEDDDEEADGEEGSGTIGDAPEIRRPEGGEVKWWSNSIGILPDGPRDQRYGWVGVTEGGSYYLRDEEATPRQAVWSPSGLSDLGGCLLAMLTSAGQISVYAPRSDPIASQWDEIADITYHTKNLLRPPIHPEEKPTGHQMREMQASYLAWSPALSLETCTGIDGSLLAVASRACGISLWSYGEDKRFKIVAQLHIGDIWASHLAWSDWSDLDKNTCQARLAYVTTEGVVGFYTIRRTIGQQEGGNVKLDCVVDDPISVDTGDGRQVTAVQWLEGTLVWTKPGSVHFSSGHQGATKTLRLGIVGNWAGCNAWGVCVGIQRISPTSIAIVLSTLTIHIIHNIHTTPDLAPLEESLVATLAARQAFLDHVHGDYMKSNVYHLGPLTPEHLTAWTSGWAGIGQDGIASLSFEVINFHNLDTTNEGKRLLVFGAIDITDSLPGGRVSVIEQLRNALDAPVNPLIRSPARELMPHVMRLVADPPNPADISDLLDICSPDEEDGWGAEPEGARSDEDMRQAFFNREDLNASRLKYALALWCASKYTASKAEFGAFATKSLRSTMASNLRVAVSYASLSTGPVASGSPDERYLRLLETRCQRLKVPSGTLSQRMSASNVADSSEAIDHCRACKGPVDMGDILGIAKCSNGHHWSRCSITGFLITSPRYRTCTTCPAIALLPSRLSSSLPIPVDSRGEDRDFIRFETATARAGTTSGDELLEQVLDSCSACIMCGGRWIRAT